MLKSEIEGMRIVGQPIFIDDDGVLFNRATRFETHVCYGRDGRALQLTATEAKDAVVVRAVRS
jgi:hypothetical protein